MLPNIKKPKKPIYLDYAATTPLDPRVKKAMDPFWSGKFGNPSSLYRQGREAKEAVEDARKSIAKIINSRPEEIIFTAGGTESINIALQGLTRAAAVSPHFTKVAESGRLKPHIITSAIEHQAVFNTVKALEGEGSAISVIGVDGFGFVNMDELKKAVRPETVLISIMYANNEIGTIQPIGQIARWIKQLNLQREEQKLPRIIFHTDACQAGGTLEMDVQKLGVDMMTINASKMYGPKQVGMLYVKSGIKLVPIIHGGGQEKDLRSGTENVPGIIGFARAFELAQKERIKENKRISKLRDYFITQLIKKIPGIILNGPNPNRTEFNGRQKVFGREISDRLPNNINISIAKVEGEALLLYLDSYGIAVSTGSACTSQTTDPSHVLLAIGRTPEQAESSIRFTLGKYTTKQELDYVMKILPSLAKTISSINIKN